MYSINMLDIALHSSTILLCVTILLFTLIQQRTDKLQNKLFITMTVIIFCNALSSVISALAEHYKMTNDTAFTVVEVMQFLYFLLHTALCPTFFCYVSYVCGTTSRVSWKKLLLYMSIFIITEIPVLLNPFLHQVYYFNDQREFCRNWAENSIYLAAAIYFALSIGKLMFSWNALSAKKKIALSYFYVIVIAGVAIQLIFIKVKCELLAEAIGVLGTMIAIESEDERIDVETGFNNRRALQSDLNSFMINRSPVTLVCLKITNGDIIQRATGSENTDILASIVSDYLKTVTPRYYIYITNPSTFIITITDNDEKTVSAITNNIIKRFKYPWLFRETEIILNAVVMAADMPERLKSPADVFYMADSPVPADNDKKLLTGSDLDYLIRRSAVEDAISRGLEEHNFEVYYQPTYCVKGRRLHGAEALIRLHDSLIGEVYPDEFITVAEQIGMIDEIDDFVLSEVCRFIKSGIPAENGMDCINVNLSVIQCMQAGFADRINDLIESFGIDKDFINFEITETIAPKDYKLLSTVVADLKKDGYHFSMDDYGTGYSNIQLIFSLDFDVVKIDKSILWSAETSELGSVILENSVRMIRQMGRKILVEGVETKEQIELLEKLSVDYLQGYYFSKPIPKKDFITHISQAHN